MKKLFVLFLIAAMVVTLAACGGKSGETPSEKADPDAPITTVDVLKAAGEGTIPELPVGLTVKMGDVRAAYLGAETLEFDSDNGWNRLYGAEAGYYIKPDGFTVEAAWKLGDAYGLTSSATPEAVTALLGAPTHSGNVSLTLPSVDTSAWTVQGYTCGEYTLDLLFNGASFAGAFLCRSETFVQ